MSKNLVQEQSQNRVLLIVLMEIFILLLELRNSIASKMVTLQA